MLTPFDWLRLAFTGAELLATLDRLVNEPSLLACTGPGAPLSALDGPCERCMVHARKEKDRYCSGCRAVLSRRQYFRYTARDVLLAWARLNQLPHFLRKYGARAGYAEISRSGHAGVFVLDDQRFLQVILRRKLRDWLQDLLLYDGGSIRGLIQFFPTNSARHGLCMNDLLGHVIHREATTPMDQLRIRFYASPYLVRRPHLLDKEGLLTFEAGHFLGILDMAAVFRRMLQPQEQDMLRELLTIEDPVQEQFYWGRFLGMLSPEARDMLHAWQVRQWSKGQVQLFYEMLSHVCVDFKAQLSPAQESLHDAY